MSKNSFPRLIHIQTWFKTRTASISFLDKLKLMISFLGALSLVLIFQQTRTMNEQSHLMNEQSRLMNEQSRLGTKNMQASMYGTIATQTLEMDRIFIESPTLRPYFYDKRDIKKDHKRTYDLAMAVAEHYLDAFDAIQTQLGYIPEDPDTPEDRDTWNNFFADSFANSPALCRRINKNRPWYMKQLKDIADCNCKYLFPIVSNEIVCPPRKP